MNRRRFLTLPAAALAPALDVASGIDLGPIPRMIELRDGVRLVGSGMVTWEAIAAAAREAHRLLESAMQGSVERERITATFYVGRFSPALRAEISWVVR